jgi:PiT family inorganic phosphate transporter
VAGNIIAAWVITLPAAALLGGVAYSVTRLFGTGAAGPIVVLVLIGAGTGFLFSRRAREAGAAPAPVEA